MNHRSQLLAIAMLGTTLAGCDPTKSVTAPPANQVSSTSAKASPASKGTAPPASSQATSSKAASPQSTNPLVQAAPSVPSVQPVNPASASNTGNVAGNPAGDMVKAGVGVGKAGSSLRNETGILVEPAKSLFATKERMVFNVQIPQALSLFKATEGRLPNSHQEFMDKIVTANNLALPKLPTGKEYVFDAQRGELMVKTTGK